jgi:iron complex transport system permease protein
MSAFRTAVRAGLLVAGTLCVVAASTLLGPVQVGWSEIVAPWTCGPDQGLNNPFWLIRVPRSCLAALSGAGLAVGGVIFQALFRNPLAEPYTLGIASGASLAAAIGFLTGAGGYVAGVPIRTVLALGGAAGAIFLVYLMARLRSGQDMNRLLLGGVCVAYLSSAGILLVTFLADRAVTNDIVLFLMGSLGVHRPRAAIEVLVALAVVLTYVGWCHRELDLLSLDTQLAASRGVRTEAVAWAGFIVVGLLTAVIVASCGPIGFVGLMVPHFARALLGVSTLQLALGSAVLGAAFLSGCDGLGRALLSLVHQRPVGYEFPVGVITNIVGAGFFFYLLATRDGNLSRR